jgi:hypothetical protein
MKMSTLDQWVEPDRTGGWHLTVQVVGTWQYRLLAPDRIGGWHLTVQVVGTWQYRWLAPDRTVVGTRQNRWLASNDIGGWFCCVPAILTSVVYVILFYPTHVKWEYIALDCTFEHWRLVGQDTNRPLWFHLLSNTFQMFFPRQVPNLYQANQDFKTQDTIPLWHEYNH